MSNGIRVTRLGHVALEVVEPERGSGVLPGPLGLSRLPTMGKTRCSCGPRDPTTTFWRCAAGCPRSVHHYAWEVAGRDDLERAAEHLTNVGAPIVYGPGVSNEPGLGHCLRFEDPDGHVLELYSGNEAVRDPIGGVRSTRSL